MLHDVVRTLKAIELIRHHGLKYRISSPQKFLRDMNKLCTEVKHVRKKREGAKKMRKNILRRMKKLVGIVEKHANNYCREFEVRCKKPI